MSVKYPYDRINGYVLLTDGNCKPYVPQFRFQEKPETWWAGFSKYWNAQRILLKRLYGKQFEPSSLSNMHLLETYWPSFEKKEAPMQELPDARYIEGKGFRLGFTIKINPPA